jgi:hypothetical protein
MRRCFIGAFAALRKYIGSLKPYAKKAFYDKIVQLQPVLIYQVNQSSHGCGT